MIVMVPFAFVCQGLQVQTLKPEAGRRRKRRLSARERCQKLEGEDRGYVGDLRGAVPGLIVCGRRLAQERRSEPALEGTVASTVEIGDIKA
jgi:hypothetical protein